jgi:hypothetical protein
LAACAGPPDARRTRGGPQAVSPENVTQPSVWTRS